MSDKNVKSRPRPLSPHLQVYKPQMTSMLSIFHRASIVAMFIATLGFVYLLYKHSFGVECACYNWFTQDETGQVIYKIILSGFALAACYWVCATIRHLFWDIGKGFEITTAYKTGLLSIITTLAFAVYVITKGIL